MEEYKQIALYDAKTDNLVCVGDGPLVVASLPILSEGSSGFYMPKLVTLGEAAVIRDEMRKPSGKLEGKLQS